MSERGGSRKAGKSVGTKGVKAERLKAKGREGPKAERPTRKAVSKPVEQSFFKNTENNSTFDPPTGGPASETIETLTTYHSPLATMEVHHHPEIEKKGFKEYLLEGLMIFIAVFMGFIAENIRENITNNEHVKQLSRQLVQDLKTDTTDLREIDSAESKILARTDTLSGLLQQPIAKADLKKIQVLTVDAYSYWPFYPSVAGITAIKNELHLKQFSNSKIGNYITAYEGLTSIAHKIEDLKSQLLRNYIETFFRLHFTPANLKAALNHQPVTDEKMRNLTQNDLTQLNTDLVLISNVSSV